MPKNLKESLVIHIADWELSYSTEDKKWSVKDITPLRPGYLLYPDDRLVTYVQSTSSLLQTGRTTQTQYVRPQMYGRMYLDEFIPVSRSGGTTVSTQSQQPSSEQPRNGRRPWFEQWGEQFRRRTARSWSYD